MACGPGAETPSELRGHQGGPNRALRSGSRNPLVGEVPLQRRVVGCSRKPIALGDDYEGISTEDDQVILEC